MTNETNKTIRYFSMFTGVGGFELGIERAIHSKPQTEEYETKQDSLGNNINKLQGTTISCIGFSEIDKYANQLLANKFPNIRNYGDCTKINPSELPDFDMLCGGFPCQSFSIAGKRRGFEDTRGTMFFEVARILKIKRPKILFLENVKGLLNHNEGQTFSIILETLDELGYETQWMVLNSKFFGVPQNRERVFIIGNLRGEPKPEILPFRCSDKEVNRQNKMIWFGRNVKTGESGINPLQEAHRVYDTSGIIQTLKPMPLKILHNVYGGFGEGIREKEEICPTIRTPKGGGHLPMIARGRPKMPYEKGKRELNYELYLDTCPTLSQNCASGDQKNIVVNEFNVRKLTPIECERLQGFPDNWTKGFSDAQRYKMMGNAVTVNVIKAIAEKLI